MSMIVDIHGRQILDSRGNPTVEVDVLTENEYLGRATNIPNVRIAVSGHYLIVYKVFSDFIEIYTIFDSRQNPES